MGNNDSDRYGPWMLVQKGGRRKSAGVSLKDKKDTQSLAQKGADVADKKGASGSRFAALECDTIIVDEEHSPMCAPSVEPMDIHQASTTRNLNHKGPKRNPFNPSRSFLVSSPSQVIMTKPIEPVPSSTPQTVTNLKRAARAQNNTNQDHTDTNLNHTPVQPNSNILIAQPIVIPQANICLDKMTIDGGVHNLRPPDPKLIDPQITSGGKDGPAQIDNLLDSCNPGMEVDLPKGHTN
ncbi:hypothetical protein SESBI_33329 [Sesbania bispinosa]|nr:hypothetical protein SESBI_33329 [Sesbania bispinosa]